ncbi:MAG: holo-ACP synthase [Chitinophagaceae bacterium]
MILGIGTDIVEIHRIEKKVENNPSFLQHVFSENEIIYCQKQKKAAMHFAARWAAKEAFLKAIHVQFIGNHKLSQIEVCHSEHGKPYIELTGIEKTNADQLGITHIHVSLSHTEHHAIAYVIVEK